MLKKYLIVSFLIINSIAYPASLHAAEKEFSSTNSHKLIRQIIISGFVLQEKDRFNKLTKPLQNKHLSQAQIFQLIDDIKSIYAEAGYAGLVSFDYQVNKNRLMIDIALNK